MIFIQLFIIFFIIGLVGFGGGYGMLSLIQGEVVNKMHWLTTSEFAEIVAISQMTPGPIGINSATFCGYRAVNNAGMGNFFSILGSITATVALVLPSFIIMVIVSKIFSRYVNSPIVRDILAVLRLAIIGLIASAALLLMTVDNFSSPLNDPYHFTFCVIIFFVTFFVTLKTRFSPIRMLLISAVLGLIFMY